MRLLAGGWIVLMSLFPSSVSAAEPETGAAAATPTEPLFVLSVEPRQLPWTGVSMSSTRWSWDTVTGTPHERTVRALPDGGIELRERSRQGERSVGTEVVTRLHGWDPDRPTAAASPTLGEHYSARYVSQGAVAGEIELHGRVIADGWVELPAGPVRAWLLRESWTLATPSGTSPGARYRWLSERLGTVAELSGRVVHTPAGPRLEVERGLFLLQRGSGPTMRVYSDEINSEVFDGLSYSLDTGATTLTDLTDGAYADVGELLAGTTWDFSGVDAGETVAATDVPIDVSETCNFDQCGFSLPDNDFMSRQDNLDTGLFTGAVFDDDGAGTFWLRAGVQFEGRPGPDPNDLESRFCYDGVDRTEVAQWVFAQPDGDRLFMQVGDAWVSEPFDCEQNLWTGPCGGIILPLRTAAKGGHSGTFASDVIAEGVVVLPSGHQVDTLVVRQVVDFSVHILGNCFGAGTDAVRQVILSFLAPQLGTVAIVNSERIVPAAEIDTWQDVGSTTVSFAVLPPLTVEVVSVGDDQVTISWDPGDQRGFVDRFKVYWGSESGAVTAYPFDSDAQPGQVDIVGNQATVTGLTPGEDVYLSVTAARSFEDPSSGVVMEYESLLFPEGGSGPLGPFPVEVMATPGKVGCAPATEITGVTGVRADGPGSPIVRLSWDETQDVCATGFVVLGSDDFTTDVGWVEVASTTATELVGDLPFTYYIVIGEGAGGQQGPWGHYGR